MKRNIFGNRMRRAVSCIVLMLCCNFALAQQIVVDAHVVDASTGEVLPFTAIQSKKTGSGTIVNYDGDFSMRVDADDELIISFIGYEKVTYKACDLPKVISLTPWDISLPEVTVTTGEGILMKASKLLAKELEKYKKNRSQYFMRMNILRTDAAAQKKDSTSTVKIDLDKQRLEIAEAFITACSMGNLRDAEVVKGLYGRKTSKGLESARTSSMDFHHVWEAGPWIEESAYWTFATLPLSKSNNIDFLRQTYDIKVEMKQDRDGNNYYIINLKRKGDTYYPRGIVTGKLYLNANTLQLLRFEGQVEDIMLSIRKFSAFREMYGLNISVNVTFKHNKGYTEVANMSCTMSSSIMETKAILFNVDDIDLKTGTLIAKNAKEGNKSKYKIPGGKSLKSNMLESIRKAGFEKELWENSNIVKRTNDEQQVFGMEADATDDYEHILQKRKADKITK